MLRKQLVTQAVILYKDMMAALFILAKGDNNLDVHTERMTT